MAGLRYGKGSNGEFLVNASESGKGTDAQVSVRGVARTTITAALLQAAFTTPIELLAAPGALFVYDIEKVVLSKAAGTAFGGIAAGEDIQIQYATSNAAVVADVETTGFLDATAAEIRVTHALRAASGLGAIDLTANLNNAIELELLVGNITLGSPVIVDVYYERLPSFLVSV